MLPQRGIPRWGCSVWRKFHRQHHLWGFPGLTANSTHRPQSRLLYQPALLLKLVLYDQLGPVLNSLLLFPIMGVTTRLYHAAIYPVIVLRTALCCLTSLSMLPVKTLAVNMLLCPFMAIREGLSYTAAYLAEGCQVGLAYEWAVPLVWYCVMPVVIVAIVVQGGQWHRPQLRRCQLAAKVCSQQP